MNVTEAAEAQKGTCGMAAGGSFRKQQYHQEAAARTKDMSR